MTMTISGTAGVTFPDLSLQAKAAIPFNGATTNANSGTALTLTASSTQVQVVKPTSPTNAIVNLPSATGLTAGDPAFLIYNQSPIGSNITINDFAGNVVGYVAAGQVAVLSLSDNSTSAGSWTCTTSTVQAFITPNTASYTTTTMTNANSSWTAVGLTSTTFVEIWNSATSGSLLTVYYRVGTISGSTISYGTTSSWTDGAVGQVTANNNTNYFSALRISDTAFAVMWSRVRSTSSFDPCTGITTYFTTSVQYVKAGTVSGTTVTFGNTVTLINQSDSSTSTTPNNAAPYGSWCPVDSTRFIYFYNSGFTNTYQTQPYSGSLTAVVYSLSGTTITAGTPVALGTSTNSVPSASCALSSSLVTVVYGQGTAANSLTGRTKAVTVSLSGSTITWNTPTSVEAADIPNAVNRYAPQWNYAMANSATQALANTFAGTLAISISGTTVTVDANRAGTIPGNLFYVSSGKIYGLANGGVYYNMVTGGYYPSAAVTSIIQTTNTYTIGYPVGQLGSVSPVTASTLFIGYTGSAAGAFSTTTRILINTN